MKTINAQSHVVLHGGLGNQLFQYFYASTIVAQNKDTKLRLVTDFLDRYSSPRTIELLPLVEGHLADKLQLSEADLPLRLRLPKLIKRLSGREIVVSIPGYGSIVDGYFQELRYYAHQHPEVLAGELADWRFVLSDRLSLQNAGKGRITHIRLGDFFTNPEEAKRFAQRHLSSIEGPTDLVTDQEDLLANELDKAALAYPVRLLPSTHMSAWDLMKLLCSYEAISTNGSTLAFWAAVMRRATFQTTNPEHLGIWQLLMNADS